MNALVALRFHERVGNLVVLPYLGESVWWNIADKGALMAQDTFDNCWTAHHLRDSSWIVRFEFVNRKKRQRAEWEVDTRERTLMARNRLASELGYLEPGRRGKPPAPLPPVNPTTEKLSGKRFLNVAYRSIGGRRGNDCNNCNTGCNTGCAPCAPATCRVWVPNRNAQTYSVISTTTERVVATNPASASHPHTFAFAPDGSVAYLSMESHAVVPGAIDVIDRVPGLAARAAHVRQEMEDERLRCRAFTREHGEDREDVHTWTWPYAS